MKMVERVTAAIVDHFTNGNEQYESLSEYERILYTAAARAAIEAMTPTTNLMDVAGVEYLRENHSDASGCFEAMIQAALKEGQ